MDQELIDLGPEFWSIPDLDQPSADCDMPEPIRPEGSVGVWHTCRHCEITFILAQCTDDVGNWQERWVNSHQHTQMNRAAERHEDDLYWWNPYYYRENF